MLSSEAAFHTLVLRFSASTCCQAFQKVTAVHREFGKKLADGLESPILSVLKRASITKVEGMFVYHLENIDPSEKVELRSACKSIVEDLKVNSHVFQ